MFTITKWGNSQGVRIPKKFLEEVGLKVGEKVDIKIEDGKIVIIPIKQKRKPKLDINELFKEDYKENKEFEWDRAGKEIW
jgi:antitoxin MazE